ncbi:site-2 protease family protein [Candidatus Nitrospira neomarina]|uniref:Site-2 protease family protein n=1 Tax=Candidatus Nitrospira neomarina TaxID=3020899 RepID=A0AA96GIM6_9BACT|nr:site-2 protease family protein [Candidatus Nitrospira neomarina]WNM61015.1 site-2 protease family protein [Candidatus Nitrospira neomarina]
MDHESPEPSTPSENKPTPPPSLLNPIAPTDPLPRTNPPAPPPLIRSISTNDIRQDHTTQTSSRGMDHWQSLEPELLETEDEVDEFSPPPPSAFSQWGLPILLFGLTVFTTLWAGAFQVNTKPVNGAWDFLMRYPGSLVNGIPFAATLLGILVTHEFGHYLLSRIHRVPASLPLFIPGPPHFIGTFGAVIRMRSAIMNRRALFDIGVAGPIAGFIAAVVAIIIGLSLSHIVPRSQTYGLQLGEPLLLQWFGWLMFGPIPPTHDIVLHPIAFAAWFGFFVTAINLLPLGQLDGGHVAFAVLGRRQRSLALGTIPILIYLGLTGWPGWILWVGLASLVGIGHPPVIDPDIVLGKHRRWVAWAALAIFIVTFAPVPFSVG